MEKAIYLHKNRNLIEKTKIVYADDPSYFCSPLVVGVWYIKADMKKEDIKLFLIDAIIKGALPLEVKRVGLEYGLTDRDIEDIWAIPV